MKKIQLVFVIMGALAFAFSCAPRTEQAENTEEEAATEEMAPNTLTEMEVLEGWELLFDGETTSGWRGYNLGSIP
jgi:hypothetical protein